VLQRLMEENPRPVIIVSSLSQEGAEATLQALDLGAFDCIPKQLSYASLDIIKIRDHLVAQIKAAAVSRPLRRRKGEAQPAAAPVVAGYRGLARPEVVVIGTSTGGPGALREIIPALPADLPIGVLVVQHMPLGFTGPLAKRLDSLSAVAVREATDGHMLQPGEVLIAPAGSHMTVLRSSAGKALIRVGDEPASTLHKPSVDVTMLSVAEAFGVRSMGVILTGMGSDGARGMAAIRERGGITVGQDEATSVVYGMPRACADRGVLRRVVPLGSVSGEIVAAARIGRS
jgi:two-component system chemotaxis response regulator CheB